MCFVPSVLFAYMIENLDIFTGNHIGSHVILCNDIDISILVDGSFFIRFEFILFIYIP